MNPLISGLILATISALAFIAYKHPKEFRVVENLLTIVLGSLMLGLTIWNSSAEILVASSALCLAAKRK